MGGMGEWDGVRWAGLGWRGVGWGDMDLVLHFVVFVAMLNICSIFCQLIVFSVN